MKIILDKEKLNYQGDIISLSRLLTSLETHRKSLSTTNGKITLKHPTLVASLDQWIFYLTGIANEILRANYEGRESQREFNLPFEKEYKKFLGKTENKK